ncbi:cupin domain-containing protein [Halieaceae bacterium]|nr:cupin domain-containing protein [Halieaceae bacterium]
MRRIITGVDDNGKAVFTRDDNTPHVLRMGNFEMGELWYSETPDKIDRAQGDAAAAYVGAIPDPGRVLMRYVVFPPESEREQDEHGKNRVMSSDFVLEESDPGMHTTETVDYGFLIDGELVLELDDGAELTMKAGDAYVQNGTRHAWRNRSNKNAVLGVVMIGAQR